MDTTFFAYLEQLELFGFFSGFPLIYALVIFIAGPSQKRNGFKNRIVYFLPYSYALSGTLYLGYLLKNLYPDYSAGNIYLLVHEPWLVIWGLGSIIFWIPLFSKRPVISLLHSLVFFGLLVKDLFGMAKDQHLVRNNMKVYSDSLLLQTCTYIVIALAYYAITRLFRKKNI